MSSSSSSSTKDKFSILLPTFNEKENLPLITYLIVESMEKHNHDFEIIVIEDNSPDGTLQAAEQLQQIYGQDKIVIYPRKGKLGLGSAYQDGVHKASGNFIFILDADLSHHPKFMPKMIEKQREENYDIVSGTRYRREPNEEGGVCGWDMRRKLTSCVANYMAHTLLAPPVSDLTGSFRLYKKEVFESIIERGLPKGYVFQMAIITHAKYMGYTTAEIPITFVDRLYGESKLGLKEIVSYLSGLIKLFFSV
eukprot:gb/GECH01014633.1/.p1 GENE.gb/GECH01014633.1/~~gb/GECH01014633.1/.p1  ORF type:complete len:251 (+),score=65.86 gb/GECH01014633.1/:1-753(+)